MATISTGPGTTTSATGGGGGGGELFKACKGRVIVASSGGVGLYELSPAIGGSSGAGKVLIHSIGLKEQQVVDSVTTLTSEKILYVFGDGWGSVNILGDILLGSSDEAKASLSQVTDYYKKHKVSEKLAPIQVSAGDTKYEVYITGLTLGRADPEFNIQSFTLHGKKA